MDLDAFLFQDTVAYMPGLPKEHIIYGLKDPRDGRIRYVGKSCYGISRARRHSSVKALAIDDTHKGRWIKQLASLGLAPIIIVLEAGLTEETLSEAEVKWIAKGRSESWGLTNICDGGEGRQVGYVCSPETKEKVRLAKLGKPRPDLVAYNLSRRGKPLKNKRKSPHMVQRNKVIKGFLGKAHTPETIEKMRQSRLGKPRSEETKAKIAATRAARKASNAPRIRLNLLRSYLANNLG